MCFGKLFQYFVGIFCLKINRFPIGGGRGLKYYVTVFTHYIPHLLFRKSEILGIYKLGSFLFTGGGAFNILP